MPKCLKEKNRIGEECVGDYDEKRIPSMLQLNLVKFIIIGRYVRGLVIIFLDRLNIVLGVYGVQTKRQSEQIAPMNAEYNMPPKWGVYKKQRRIMSMHCGGKGKIIQIEKRLNLGLSPSIQPLLVFLELHPSSFVPKSLKWPLLVAAHPPQAKPALKYGQRNANEQRVCGAGI